MADERQSGSETDDDPSAPDEDVSADGDTTESDEPAPPSAKNEKGAKKKDAGRAKRPKDAKDQQAAKKNVDTSADEEDWAPRPIMSKWKAFGLATVTGVLAPVGFVGIDIWPIAFIAWVPLIIAMRGQQPRRAAWLGWWSGFLMTMIGFSWLVEMLEVFSGFPLAACVLFAAILCLQKGGRIALMGYLYGRASTRYRWHHGVTFLMAFAVSELVYPLLFPWYYAASMHEVPVMMQTADIGGPILVSIVILAVNVAVAELLEKPVFGLQLDRRMAIAGAVIPALALGYGAWRMSSIDARVAEAEPLKVGMVQGNSPLMRRSRALEVHFELTKKLREQNVDLVVWSEAAASRSFLTTNYESHAKEVISKHLDVPAIIGVVLIERLPAEGGRKPRSRLYNSALIANAEGDIGGRYDKQFLLMFGEYLPFSDTFPQLHDISPNSGHFTPGTSFDPLRFEKDGKTHELATMICYEDIIPSFVNKLVDAGDPELLVNMTNDAWFGDTAEPWQHLALAQFRSIEHRLYMVRVTNSGVTAIIDPVGRTPVVSETFKQQALTGEVRFLKIDTLYSQIHDIPWWIVAALLALMCVVKRPDRKLRPTRPRRRTGPSAPS